MFRRILLTTAAVVAMSGAAFAADLPTSKGPPVYAPPPPPIFTWTGFYLGVNAGGAISNSSWITPTPGFPVFSVNGGGFAGGGQVGYNYQISSFVVGVEGGVEGLTVRNHAECDGVAGSDCVSRQSVLGTFVGRVGFTPIDRVLFYATGGGAVSHFSLSEDALLIQSWNTGTRVGWTVGGGVEYAIPNMPFVAPGSVILGVDYKYYDFGTGTATGGIAPVTLYYHEREHTILGRLSYKFDMMAPPLPVAAKY